MNTKQEQIKRQFERGEKVVLTHPYWLLEKGPTLYDCPLHSEEIGNIFYFHSSYFKERPLRSDSKCSCRVRQISQKSCDQYLKSGKYQMFDK